MSAGFTASFFIDSDSNLYSCGNAVLTCQEKDGYVPLKVATEKKVKQICCGMKNVAMVTTDGQLYSWGDNTFG